ncbi:MAG: hypothetical protein OEZ59_08590 [Deltaproteobacteria bacterium]|nr:hypothetical protein [Deltaproteobacteria bacterium]
MKRSAWLPGRPLAGLLFSALFSLMFVLTALGGHTGSAMADERPVGAFFTLVNTYIYSNGPLQGSRFLVRPRRAFVVFDYALDSQDRIWYRIAFPDKTNTVKGEGWTPKAPHELLPSEREPVLVYSRPIARKEDTYTTVDVPVQALELLHETIISKSFPRITWQKVKYSFDTSQQAWVRGGSGIFRPGKAPDFMIRTYEEMVTQDLEKEKRNRLLAGMVQVGDTTSDVQWALGNPLRKQEEKAGEALQATWEYPEYVIRLENFIVKSIN